MNRPGSWPGNLRRPPKIARPRVLVTVRAELGEAMRRAGIDLDFVRDPGTLQFPGKGRDIIHGYGRVRPTMGNRISGVSDG